jgi:integrase
VRGRSDLNRGQPRTTRGGIVYFTPELKSLVTAQVERLRALERQMGQIISYLFPYLQGPHRGQQVKDFRKAWKTACLKAGCPGMLRHDFQRTACGIWSTRVYPKGLP